MKLALSILLCVIGIANAADPIKISREEASRNLISSIPIIRTAESSGSPFRSIRIDLVIDTNGAVRSAEAPRQSLELDLAQFISQASDLAKGLKYRPFLRDGVPVEVHTEEYVRILPPEKTPITHVPFPVVDNLSTLEFSLKRTTCFGSCPHYEIRITGNGIVTYTGHDYVAVEGQHTDRISPEEVQLLLDAFRHADFFSLSDKYVMNISDNPTFEVGIKIAAASKTVTDYAGLRVGMPLAITDLENQIDRLARSSRWLRTDRETIPSLQQEGFAFKSETAGLMLIRTVALGDEQLVRDLIDLGAPVTTVDARADTALVSAARFGKLATVDLLIEHGADAKNPRVLNYAAEFGAPAVVASILKGGADVNARDAHGETTIFKAAEAHGLPANRGGVIRLLISSAADPNVKNEKGDTALHIRFIDPDALKALIAAGANVNALNDNGETPLMTTSSPEAAAILLQAGADISIHSKAGKTALEIARQRADKKIATLIEKAASLRN
jgi:ankyrin repeat protein